MLTLFGWSSLDAEKIEFVKQTVFSNTRALLQKWATEREATAATARTAGDESKSATAPRRKRAASRSSTTRR
jgi:hypothetical protein